MTSQNSKKSAGLSKTEREDYDTSRKKLEYFTEIGIDEFLKREEREENRKALEEQRRGDARRAFVNTKPKNNAKSGGALPESSYAKDEVPKLKAQVKFLQQKVNFYESGALVEENFKMKSKIYELEAQLVAERRTRAKKEILLMDLLDEKGKKLPIDIMKYLKS